MSNWSSVNANGGLGKGIPKSYFDKIYGHLSKGENIELSFEEIQERISMLCDQAVEESNTSGCDINSIKEIEKEIDALEELRESKPEWGAFLKEVEESRKSEDCPF